MLSMRSQKSTAGRLLGPTPCIVHLIWDLEAILGLVQDLHDLDHDWELLDLGLLAHDLQGENTVKPRGFWCVSAHCPVPVRAWEAGVR